MLKKYKIIKLAVILVLVTVNALEAKSLTYDIHMGVMSLQSDLSNKTEQGEEYAIGFGIAKRHGLLYLGVDFDGSYTKVKTVKYNTDSDHLIATVLKAGVNLGKSSLYSKVGVKATGSSEGFYGFGYGAGVQWQIIRGLLVSAELMRYDMKGTEIDLVYTTSGFYIKRAF